MNKQETLELVKQKLFLAVETRKNPKYLELYLNDACAFISYEPETRLLCIEFLVRIGDIERAEKHILDTDSSVCSNELKFLRAMLMSKKGERNEGRTLLENVNIETLTENGLRLYVSAQEEYGEFDAAFEILKGNISRFPDSEFLLKMLIRFYDEMIIKAALFNNREKAQQLKSEQSNHKKHLEGLITYSDEQ